VRRIALPLVLAATPAAAATDDLLECPATRVTPAFRDKIAAAMLAPDSAESDALFQQVGDVAERCAGEHGLPEDRRDAYFTYALSRMPHDAFIAKLGALGISAAVIDEALDFGPGRTNPLITGSLDDAQVTRLVAALEAGGVDTAKVASATWEMVGGYAAATSQMWQARAKLP